MKQLLIFGSSSKIYNCCQYNLFLKLSTSLFLPQVIPVFFLVFTVIKFSPDKQASLLGRYSQFLLALITAFSLALSWQFQFYTYSFILIYRTFNYHNNLWLFWKQDWCGRPHLTLIGSTSNQMLCKDSRRYCSLIFMYLLFDIQVAKILKDALFLGHIKTLKFGSTLVWQLDLMWT